MTDPKDPNSSGPPPGGKRKDDLANAYDALVSEYAGGEKAKGAKGGGDKERRANPGGKDDLVAAYDKVLADDERQRNEATRKEVGARRVIAPMALTVLVAFSVYVWLAKPFDSQIPIPPVTVGDTHGLRQLMVATTQMIEDYRQEKGRLPVTLAEAGIDAGPVEYLQQKTDYALKGMVGDSTITLKWSSASEGEVEMEAHGKTEGTL
jgi:hypothetical protein